MPAVDPNRDLKDAEAILKRITKRMKKECKPHGDIDYHVSRDSGFQIHYIIVECHDSFGWAMEEEVARSKFAKLLGCTDHEGWYDWPSDTYHKPTTMISFRY
jgi:Uri superfamily endonuclease